MAGLFLCCVPDDAKAALVHSNNIDRILAKERQLFKRTVKILLLGSGESGKSTFLKQIKIIHGDNFSPDAIAEYRVTIYMNVVKGMRVLLDAKGKLGMEWEDGAASAHADVLYSYDMNSADLSEPMFQLYAPSVKALWQDGAIRKAYERRSEFQLIESVKYFFDNIDRLLQKSYTPTLADILHARKATKGIVEYDIDIKGIPFKFVDVGGQRSQRQKWFQCFDSVTSILFLASSSEFDQKLMEDRRTNRVVESVNIFETIVKNRSFLNVSIILFLNKTDLLEEKIKIANIAEHFPQFTGDPRNLRNVQQFLLRLFEQKCKESPRQKPLFHHFTTAVDTENIKFVFQAAKDTILQENLQSLMMQ